MVEDRDENIKDQEENLEIDGTFEDVLRISVPEPKEKK